MVDRPLTNIVVDEKVFSAKTALKMLVEHRQNIVFWTDLGIEESVFEF